MKHHSTYSLSTGVIIGMTLVLCLVLSACNGSDRMETDAVADRASMPVLNSKGVTTLISDSGVTRYRITTASWQIYDKADPVYWEFPEGVYLEKFDSLLKVEASLQADYAYYNEREERWLLRGNVHTKNLEGEEFDTPLLYWDKRTERVYSDSAITIKKATSIIYGVGFESNQQMTQYTIRNPKGMIPLEEKEDK